MVENLFCILRPMESLDLHFEKKCTLNYKIKKNRLKAGKNTLKMS